MLVLLRLLISDAADNLVVQKLVYIPTFAAGNDVALNCAGKSGTIKSESFVLICHSVLLQLKVVVITPMVVHLQVQQVVQEEYRNGFEAA